MSDMLKQVADHHATAKGYAKTGGNDSDSSEELPQGASPIEEGEETPVGEEEASKEASEGGTEGEEPVAAAAEGEDDDGPVRIGDQEFKSAREAIKYAEQLEREKLISDAHTAGVREALEATRKPEPQAEPEDDFEQRFYANPKETLKGLKEEAKREALAAIQAETKREKLWNDFLSEYPDIRRKDAERVLQENWETIGKMTDLGKAQKALAARVRAEYEEIRNLTKPRTELPGKKQVVSPSGGARPGVTPQKKDTAPLSFAQELRNLRKST